MPKELPQRSCLGCGAVKDKADLLRFVLAPDRTVVPDVKQKLPGRGAYTCLNAVCLGKATARKQFSRAFKGEVRGATAGELVEKVRQIAKDRLLAYVALANKAGKVVSGSDMVLDLLRKREKPGVVLIAADISEEIGGKVRAAAAASGVPSFVLCDKDRFGEILGKSSRSVLAVQPSGFVETFLKEFEIYRNFSDGGSH